MPQARPAWFVATVLAVIMGMTAAAYLTVDYVGRRETEANRQRLNAKPPRDVPALPRAITQPGFDKVK